MSGFSGLLSSDGGPVDAALLRRITASMAYCGPDHQGVWVEGQIGLGHALLAATPQPAAAERQPSSLDGRTWIAADARVDGRADLVAELGAQGRAFPPETPDAHLILLAYDAWGEDCLAHLIGDFAFAIWDGARHKLFCARDHFGVIPFYYARAAGDLAFSNVLRAVRLHPGVTDALNDRAIGDFLLFGLNMDPATTTFAGVHALPPAHALTWDGGVARVRRYWEPPAEHEVRFERPQEHVERFQAAFDQAVGDRLRASRAGTHLSGGMDSTSVAVTAHRLLESRHATFDLRAYTLVFDSLIAEEEGRYADMVAARMGLRTERLVVDDYWTRAPDGETAWAFPEPGPMPDLSPDYEIGRRVSTFARVLLTGLGGDPLFSVARPASWRDRLRGGVRTALRRRPVLGGVPDWIEPGFARRLELGERLQEVHAARDVATGPGAMLHPIWARCFAMSHPGADGMRFKTLFPFFDVRLARCVWEAPSHPWRHDKRLLRDAMEGHLPVEVLERPKTPLYVGIQNDRADNPRVQVALRPDTRRWRSELMTTARISAYVDVDQVRRLMESPSPNLAFPFVENSFTLAHWLRFGLATITHSDNEETHHDAEHASP